MNLTWAAPDGGRLEFRVEGEGPDRDGDNRRADEWNAG